MTYLSADTAAGVDSLRLEPDVVIRHHESAPTDEKRRPLFDGAARVVLATRRGRASRLRTNRVMRPSSGSTKLTTKSKALKGETSKSHNPNLS